MPEPCPSAQPPSDPAFIEALRTRLERRTGRPVRFVETHVSWVLLDGEHAWKLKKPVRLGFLDFSSPQVRAQTCREELRLNKRLAPELYLDVVAVRGSRSEPEFDCEGEGDYESKGEGEGEGEGESEGEGGHDCDGKGDHDKKDEVERLRIAPDNAPSRGEPIDHAVKMREFPAEALLDTRLANGRLTAGDIDQLADCIADFHARAEPAPPGFGSPETIAADTTRVLDSLARLVSPTRHQAVSDLRAWCDGRARVLAPVFAARRAAGRVRDCHGDLHLANTVALASGVTAFDCIEFDPALRMTDVYADVAFLAMDLMAHGRSDLAMRFVDRWLERSGDHDGLPVLRYYLVYRALVRAMVAAIRSAQQASGPASGSAGRPDYLALALQLAAPASPTLAVMHGLSGSGKSTHAAQRLERDGAIRLRSDVIRKRLFGLAADSHSAQAVRGGIYDEATTEQTYARLLALARAALDDGWPVIVDATFLRVAQRRPFQDLAAQRALSFTIVDCRAPLPMLRARIEKRRAAGADPSEADATVLARQHAHDEPFDEREAPCVEALDAAGAGATRVAAR
jgi:aminoglycoside phosphotransferase family enzyme/predicted kinase